ncbi:MAG: SRPBCC domain-containing protein [Blastochloris sp.]|nr:SRPBCC domain-containing protein [Blastochloris sp.]
MNQGHSIMRFLSAKPLEAYHALTHRIPEWWSSDFEGQSASIGDVFTVRFGSTFKRLRIVELENLRHVAWICEAQRIVMPEGMAPLGNEAEWVGQTIRWTLVPEGTGTMLSFLHEGLTPESECWSVCEPGWDQTLQSLALLLETGKGRPFAHLDEAHLALLTRKPIPTPKI